jgi:uncharacterized membrane-anchored protein YhcB (DUF1043 family)
MLWIGLAIGFMCGGWVGAIIMAALKINVQQDQQHLEIWCKQFDEINAQLDQHSYCDLIEASIEERRAPPNKSTS